MYTVFQVASDDETTQRNGLVALYSHNESNVLDYLGLAMHQTESIRFFGAAPVRYSAVHCFLPDESSILRGFVANSVGKRTRLITRVHAGEYSTNSLFVSNPRSSSTRITNSFTYSFRFSFFTVSIVFVLSSSPPNYFRNNGTISF